MHHLSKAFWGKGFQTLNPARIAYMTRTITHRLFSHGVSSAASHCSPWSRGAGRDMRSQEPRPNSQFEAGRNLHFVRAKGLDRQIWSITLTANAIHLPFQPWPTRLPSCSRFPVSLGCRWSFSFIFAVSYVHENIGCCYIFKLSKFWIFLALFSYLPPRLLKSRTIFLNSS